MTGTLSRLQTAPAERGRRGSEVVDDADTVVPLLAIGADLLPRQTAAGRAGRGRRLVATGVVTAAVLAVGGGWFVSAHARTGAEDALAVAQDRQRTLQTQQRSFDDLVRTTTQADALRTALGQVMATDTPWSTVLADLTRVRGAVTFTSVTGGVDSPATRGTTGTTSATSTTGATGPVTVPGAIGQLTVSGTAPDKPSVAAFVESLGAVDGFANPFLSSVSTVDGGSSSFTVSVTLTGDLRTAAAGRWAATSGGGK